MRHCINEKGQSGLGKGKMEEAHGVGHKAARLFGEGEREERLGHITEADIVHGGS